MRKLFVSGAVLAALTSALFAQPVGAGSSAVASGAFTLQQGGGVNRTFAFSVNQLPDGTITGMAEVNTFFGSVNHYQINCFQVVGNEAVMGGIVTQSNDPSNIGLSSVWAVEDNPDMSTFVWTFFPPDPPVTCANYLGLFGEPDLASFINDFADPLANGQITIH
jgi:hypothetical protein